MNYLLTFFSACVISYFLTPVMKKIAVAFKIFDMPVSKVKTHASPVPYLGGIAIWLGFAVTLILFAVADKPGRQGLRSNNPASTTMLGVQGSLEYFPAVCLRSSDEISFVDTYIFEYHAVLFTFSTDERQHLSMNTGKGCREDKFAHIFMAGSAWFGNGGSK